MPHKSGMMFSGGASMSKVILFGLTEEEISIIEDSGLRCDWMICDVYQDVIAHYADLTVINPDALDHEGRICLTNYFKEIDPVDEKVILTSEDPAFNGISFVEAIPDLFEYPDSIPVILMRNLKKTRRDVDYSRRIMLAIKILHLIRRNPGITSRKLSEMVEGVSIRSVKRYIRSLQAAGILIDYQDKGWVCEMDPGEIL